MSALKSTRLLDQFREQIRCLHYSLRSGQAYAYWVKKLTYFHHKRQPRDTGALELKGF
jgi:hypothetical protein